MALAAVLIGLWGLALFITNSGPSRAIWVWRYDLLSSRLIGVMLLAIAAGLLYSFRFRDVDQVMLATLITYGLGLAAASLWNVVIGKSFSTSYVVVFSLVSLISLLFLFVNRRTFPEQSY